MTALEKHFDNQKAEGCRLQRKVNVHFSEVRKWILVCKQCLSQDLETGCLKLAVVKFWGVQIFKGDHNILIFQP